MSGRGGRRPGPPNWGKTPQVDVSALSSQFDMQCQSGLEAVLDVARHRLEMRPPSRVSRRPHGPSPARGHGGPTADPAPAAGSWPGGTGDRTRAASGRSVSTCWARPRIRSAAWARSLTTVPATTRTSGLVASPGAGARSVSRVPLFRRALKACRETPTAAAASLRRRTWTCTYPNVESRPKGGAQRHAQLGQFRWSPLLRKLPTRVSETGVFAGQLGNPRGYPALPMPSPNGWGLYPFGAPERVQGDRRPRPTRGAPEPGLPWALQSRPGLGHLLRRSSRDLGMRLALRPALPPGIRPHNLPETSRQAAEYSHPGGPSSAPVQTGGRQASGKAKTARPEFLAGPGYMRFH